MPKVSIIVPCWGVEKYLDRCMQSLLNQSLKDIEIIMVDDKSPDSCPQLCDEYAKKFSSSSSFSLKVIHKEKNEGLGFARNTGLEVATGEYVAFVDSDDFVELDMYEKLYNEAKSSGADVVFCNYIKDSNTGAICECREIPEQITFEGDEVRAFMLDMVASAPHVPAERRIQMSVWHGIYRRSIIQDNNLRFLSERTVGSEDIPIQVDFLNRSKCVVYIPDCLYHYCENSTSLTSKYPIDIFKRYIVLYAELKKRLPTTNEAMERLDRFFIGYSRYCIKNIINNVKDNSEQLLDELLGDPIWKEIRKGYKPAYLPFPNSMFYWLTIHRSKVGLKTCCWIFKILKR